LGDLYPNSRQITVYDEDRQPGVQILTSNRTLTPARLITRMRARWTIENTFKSLTAYHGIDQICDYQMDLIDDTRPVDNPARKTINTELAGLRTERKTVSEQIGTVVTDLDYGNQQLAEKTRLQKRRDEIDDRIDALTIERKTLPAKVPANTVTAGRQRALPKLERRAYQMILRLAAYNALRWTAEQLNTYLDDPDEIHATTRALLHQPGTITYTPTGITVTITEPDTPIVARALDNLCDQLNHATTPARIPGDKRPITYRAVEKWLPGRPQLAGPEARPHAKQRLHIVGKVAVSATRISCSIGKSVCGRSSSDPPPRGMPASIETFRRLQMDTPVGSLLIDFAIDSSPSGPPLQTVDAPTFPARELAARKVVALFDRAAARDFADVHTLSNHFDVDSLSSTSPER